MKLFNIKLPTIKLSKMRYFNMKLKGEHLLAIVCVVLILSMMGYGVREYFDNSDALPEGIPESEIPEGDEHLYIKKTEIVPPVCPKCPDVTACPDSSKGKKCPPCPPCGRCPEPAFECKKVPNYRRSEGDSMPKPVLSNFSQFGM